MRWINRLLNVNLIRPDVKTSVMNARGNIRDDFPSDFEKDDIKLIRSVLPFTMTSHERLVSLLNSLDYLVKNKIAGDIVECGVWRGGSMALAARKLVNLKETQRKLFLFDTFEGMPPPTEYDKSAVDHTMAKIQLQQADKFEGNNVWCYSTLEEVKKNLEVTGYPKENICYFKGKVEDTLPEPAVKDIALLRLDTDWYESTKHELETLFDHLVPGGIMIIDDYGHWSGAKKAVDEFFEKRQLPVFLSRIDYTGRLYIKN